MKNLGSLLSALLVFALLVFWAAPAAAQVGADDAEEGTTGLSVTWDPVYPEKIIKSPDPALLNFPGRYLVIRTGGKTLHVQPKELWRNDREIDGRAQAAFTSNRSYWPNTTRVRAYDHAALIALLGDYVNSDSAILTYTIKLMGSKLASQTQRTPMKDLEILRLPQTWENIWITQVTVAPSAERINRVKAFDAAFTDAIENPDGHPDGFSRAEQNAYARFYQEQFNYARNANPDDSAIYRELAAYHHSNDNIDAMIGVYLDALRHDLPPEDSAEFNLAIGEALVNRLSLFEEAKEYLRASQQFAQSRLLLMRCHFALGEYEEAARLAEALSEIELAEARLRESDDPAAIGRQAILLKARALLADDQLKSAEMTFSSLLQDATPEGDEAAWMLASMFVYSAGDGDDRKAMATIESRAPFKARLAEALQPSTAVDPLALDYDPLGAKALTIWADAQIDPKFGSDKPVKTDALTPVLDYAALLDPLNADPFLVHGKAREVSQEWAEAEAAYRRGLEIAPNHLGINYRLGVLLLRAGSLDRASERFLRCLQTSKNFYHAMNRLAEISVLRADGDERRFLEAKQLGNGELADLAFTGMVQELRRGASLFATSLSILDEQEAVRTSLAELYCKLADSAADPELKTSFLNRARTMADRSRRKADADAAARKTAGVTKVSRNDLAMVPPLAAHCIYAYASYQLGAKRYLAARQGVDGEVSGFADAERYFAEAQAALDVVKTNYNSPFYFPNGTTKEFAESPAYLWAKYWRTRIEVNGRRTRLNDDFEREVSEETFSKTGTLGFGWGIQGSDILDTGLARSCSVTGGAMRMRLIDQSEAGHISRISRVEPNDQIARFSVTIPELGESRADRGIHLTLVSNRGSSDGARNKMQGTLMVGIDRDFGIFWELRSLTKDETRSKGESLFRDDERRYLDPLAYGGQTLKASDSLKLEISRIVEEDGKVAYSIHVNGWEIPITIAPNVNGLGTGGAIADFSNVAKLKPDARYTVYLGLWMRGVEGDSGQLVASEASWVIDSNLDGRD